MVAILVDSRQEGKTGWVATRGLDKVKVEGIAGCAVELHCLPMEAVLVIDADGEYNLPLDTESVMAKHIETGCDSKVFVDLVR